MRTTTASLIIVGIVAFYWGWPEAEKLQEAWRSAHNTELILELNKDGIILCLALIALLDSLILRRKRNTEHDTQITIDDLNSTVSTLETDKKNLENSVNEKSQEIGELRIALEESQQRLQSEKSTKELRPETVDAELINLLSIFQQKGRLIDFLMDDVTPYSDAQVGAAARIVHQGCSGVLKDFFSIAPITEDSEGKELTLEKQFNPKQYRIIGKVKGEPPFTGKVVHRGWKTEKISLPRIVSKDDDLIDLTQIIAPSEIEVR